MRGFDEWDEPQNATCKACGDPLTPGETNHCRYCVDQQAHEDREDWTALSFGAPGDVDAEDGDDRDWPERPRGL
mgnify:CR=1 FL=1